MPATNLPANEVQSQGPKFIRFLLGAVLFGVALFFGISYLAQNAVEESTDDAFIDAHISSIASRAAGEVVATHVTENQTVVAGDLLVEMDPRDAEVRVSRKQAALQSSMANLHAFEAAFELMRARVATSESTRKQTEAEAEASRATYDNAEANWSRASNIWANTEFRAISRQDYDAAKSTVTSARANWQANVQKTASDASKVMEAKAQVTAAEKLYEQAGAQVRQSEADVKAAELELSYTKIKAPVGGRVTRKMVEKGAYVQAGQNLLAIVRPEIWVTANFKETQTRRIRAGQLVRIETEGITNRAMEGHVESVQSGSGARFSLLPPENAVGNFVKVVQRVPVKIVFNNPMQAMEGFGPGMSVTPTVQIGQRHYSDTLLAILAVVVSAVAFSGLWLLKQRHSRATPKV
ncbi:MAG: HlyD family secretion protein [Verrucomicrobiales bacterium]|nr:HlyD family secretion protein [Verrucomicrobiales bacterium]